MKEQSKIKIRDLSFSYFGHPILDNVNAEFVENRVTAIIGPSGQGKSTLLTILNRLCEGIPGNRVSGKVEIRFNDLFSDIHDYPVDDLRRRVGLLFQAPNPLPMSIMKNMSFPLKLAGLKDRELTRHKIETALQQAFLWDEVKDRLDDSALSLSGGQQQRLCIARAMIMEPEVLLLDEPTSSLDSRACEKIEQLMANLAQQCTLVMVSHYLDQVKRVADTIWKLEDRTLLRTR